MSNVAAVDCGSLSTRLLVCGPRGAPLARLMEITRLGEGVDSGGVISAAAMARVMDALRRYKRTMDELGVAQVRMVGTSALRDAGNRELFCQQAAAVVGAEVELLSGREEGALSYLGATRDLEPATGPWLVVDIGGGSTELVAGQALGDICSLNLGCVRLTERFFHHDPPSPAEVATASEWLNAQYAGAVAATPGLRAASMLVGLAGTVSALACYDQGLTTYESTAVHHYRLSLAAVRQALGEMAQVPAAARAGRPGIEAGRARFIVAGALILATVMSYFGFDECLVSEADILDGLAASLLAAPAPKPAR